MLVLLITYGRAGGERLPGSCPAMSVPLRHTVMCAFRPVCTRRIRVVILLVVGLPGTMIEALLHVAGSLTRCKATCIAAEAEFEI